MHIYLEMIHADTFPILLESEKNNKFNQLIKSRFIHSCFFFRNHLRRLILVLFSEHFYSKIEIIVISLQ